jgi:type 1 glutamine amidotransferase
MQFAEYPMVMTIRYGNSNVVNIPMGHDVRALKVPGTAELIRKSAAWTVGLIK